jgi:hypothetical protein
MVPEFHDFPSTAITVEFWMQSVDTCRPGVPFSYAHGRYQQEDNSFLVLNYNSWWAVLVGFLNHNSWWAVLVVFLNYDSWWGVPGEGPQL